MILKKNEYLIRVKKSNEDRYLLEFSKDKFKTIKVKEFPDRDALMEVLNWQYTDEELGGI